MTKRTNKPKTTVPAAPTNPLQAPTEAVESVKQESNTVVAPKAQRANSTAKKPTQRKKTSPKVAEVERVESKLAKDIVHVAGRVGSSDKVEFKEVKEKPTFYQRFVAFLDSITKPFA